ncbi:vitamin B12 dependent-methionine synthase activation domain-containing protein [Abyssisolibacter fermentans]|uniref:vitamin B12 dependent-methionine synthase activation domain-containing protein n=1 Tax=Abyssisolibacter fermentans TaxID=1766203 RepID=UPI000833261B|nr:vitamin B12 dependent-methionine synthase activation domain-containing protein [Abyssisolibacter fermentans]
MVINPNKIKKISLDIEKKEVLRYLGYKNCSIDEITKRIIEFSIKEIKELCEFKYVFNIFDIKKLNHNIYVTGSVCKLNGNDIFNHLKTSDKCAIMAVTLGNEVDKKIRYYSNIDITKSIIFDACASVAVENLCDSVENIIKRIAFDSGYYTTTRFSPGYGDFPIDSQFEILEILKAPTQIGLTVTEKNILIPRKSVTAIIGFSKSKDKSDFGCKKCKMFNNCTYAKRGEECHA